MAHYFIRGAWKRDAADASRVVFAQSEDAAREDASKAGLMVMSVEPLDEGLPVREDAGMPSALSRIASQLSRDGRTDDAAATMFQVYAMQTDAEPMWRICMRVPRYYLKAGRRDEAWQILNAMRDGSVRGNSLPEARFPSDWEDWYSMAARVLKADGRRDQERVMIAATRIVQAVSEVLATRDGVRGTRITNRDEAAVATASILAEVLPPGTDVRAWADGIVPQSADFTVAEATNASANIDTEILRALA